MTLVMLLVALATPSLVSSAEITFCDNNSKVTKSRDQCSSGFTFGTTKPDCVCIKGIYRFWTDSCETSDGFAEEVCSKLKDKSGKNIVALQLTKDPMDWDQTGIVCEKKGTPETWDLITISSRPTSTIGTSFYSLNGKAFMDVKGKKATICVKHAELPEHEKICKYFKKSNANIWTQSEVQVEVRKDCAGSLLQHDSCFGPLQRDDSECDLPCVPRHLGRSSKKANDGKKGAQKAGGSAGGPTENFTNPADYRRHDNKYLNRKMLIYNIISQIEDSPINNGSATVPYGSPKKTFELFNMMKTIAQNSCPSTFVSPDWIDLVVNLFYILHKGNVYQYEETLTEEEFQWIKSILTKCSADIRKVELTVQSPSETGKGPSVPATETCGDGGKAMGYCNGTSAKGCNHRPIVVSSDRANASYHFVPEVAWNIVDLAQVACFKSFNASYRMFHVLQQAAEKLFTLHIKNLWYNPDWSKKTKTKLLGAGADMQLYNFEACIESAYDRNGKIPRLLRPSSPKYIRRKRAVQQTPIVKSSQVFCSRTKSDFKLPSSCSKSSKPSGKQG